MTAPPDVSRADGNVVEKKRRRNLRQRLLDAVTWLTTPLLPDDYLGLINPLWSSRELRGRLEAVQPETADAASLVIRPGLGWAGHRAGQYVRVGVDIDGVRHWRSYSLSSPPQRTDGCVTITVKAAPDGLVSPYLVRPLAAILRSLAVRGKMPDVVLVHSAPTPEDVIFGTELRTLAARFPSLRLHERHTRVGGRRGRGRFTVAQLPDICPDWSQRHAWVCGPAGMLDDAERHWRGAGIADRLHVERFRPAVGSAGGAGGRVRFVASGREVDADGGTPLLVVGEDAGVLMPSGCRMGICYSCVTRLRSGRVRDLRSGQEHGDEGELIQTCVSAAAGTVEVER